MRFYSEATNSRGNTVGTGGKKSGQDVHTRGWNAGVRVVAKVDTHGNDFFEIYLTGGSNKVCKEQLIGCVADWEQNQGPVYLPGPSIGATLKPA